MKKVYEDSTTEIFETDTHIFGISKDNSLKNYYSVSAKEKDKKGKIIATRCSYEKAMDIIKNYK